MARGRVRKILFRIFYSTSFTIVFLLTIAFACAGPIDLLYQSYRRNRLIDLFIVGGIYFTTGLVATFFYASRLYTNRSILKDIPKTYMPLDKGELPGKRVWRLIEDCKNRSAVIAYLARPRSRRVEVEVSYARDRIHTLLRPEHSEHYRPYQPQWGVISHPGWSSPAAKDTPNLAYNTVVAELTDLIEARAVSLAPVDPDISPDEQGLVPSDEDVIEALRRPEEIGMRQYMSQLVSFDVLEDNSLLVAFLILYERARFAPEPLSEDEFNSLMRMFAEVLRTMKPVNTSQLDLEDKSGNDHRDDRLLGSRPIAITHSPAAMASSSSLASSTAGSVRRHYPTTPFNNHNPTTSSTTAVPRISHDSVRSISSNDLYTDAENFSNSSPNATWSSPTSRPPFFRIRSSQSYLSSLSHNHGRSSRNSRNRNQSPRHPTTGRVRSRLGRMASRRSLESDATEGSNLSLRSLRSARSNGSVIRLNPDFERSGDLPYQFVS